MWYLNETPQEVWAWYPLFSKEECQKIIDIGCSSDLHLGGVSSENNINDIRKSKIRWLPPTEETKWIYEKCTTAVMSINSRYYNYDLEYIQDLQFTSYDVDNPYYGKHTDLMNKRVGPQRKLTFSIQLSDPMDYDGGELLLHFQNDPVECKRDLGVMSFFSSYVLHEVKPVTRGIRYSLVGWCAGPNMK